MSNLCLLCNEKCIILLSFKTKLCLFCEECVGGIDSQQVYGYALYKEGKYAKLTYPLQEYTSDVSGRSFHHGRFIQRLREKAASLPK